MPIYKKKMKSITCFFPNCFTILPILRLSLWSKKGYIQAGTWSYIAAVSPWKQKGTQKCEKEKYLESIKRVVTSTCFEWFSKLSFVCQTKAKNENIAPRVVFFDDWLFEKSEKAMSFPMICELTFWNISRPYQPAGVVVLEYLLPFFKFQTSS